MATKNIKKAENLANSEKLRNYFRSLPIEDSQKKAQEMTEACKVPRSTFNNWRSGACSIPELAQDKINEIAGTVIF